MPPVTRRSGIEGMELNRALELARRFEQVRSEGKTQVEQERSLRNLEREFGVPESVLNRLQDAFQKGENLQKFVRSLFASENPAAKVNLPPPLENRNASVKVTGTQGVQPAAETKVSLVTAAEVEAVREFREIYKSGKLHEYYQAVTGAVDNPALKEEAMALFSALPAIGPSADPDLFRQSGLWAVLPKRVDDMLETARYVPGRPVFVKTTVNGRFKGPITNFDFMSYEEGGTQAITYRARLAGEVGDSFLVKVDGREEPLEVPKAEVFALNQPHDLETAPKVTTRFGEGYQAGNWWSTVANYNSPYLKAKIAEAALKVERYVGEINYAEDSKRPLLRRQDAVKAIHDSIDMLYPDPNNSRLKAKGRMRTTDAGRQAMFGVGMCREQASVMYAMLAPFEKVLGFDLQFVDGVRYAGANTMEDVIAKGGRTEHGWLQIQYRPTMEVFIVDRTWNDVNLPTDFAYFNRRGDRYPIQFEDFMRQRPVDAQKDVLMDGSVTVENIVTQFPPEGLKIGRENHMRNWQ